MKSMVSVAALLAAMAPALASADEVRIFNWSDYIDDSLIEEFEAEFGIDVIYDVYDDNSVLEARLLAGQSGYDVVVPSGYYLGRQIPAGLFAELNVADLPNLSNMNPAIMERVAAFDPGNKHSVNYMWGTTGIGYNINEIAARIDNPPTDSWALLLDPDNAAALADCGIYVLDSGETMLPMVMAYLGLEPSSVDQEDLAAAEEALTAIRPYIEKFHSSEYISALASGDICLAVGYSGDIFQARDRAAEADNGVSISYVIPSEGTQIWFDQLAIPADAPNVANAHTFINFMMRPDVIARATNYVYYANGNAAATDLINADIATDPAIYPPESVVEGLFTGRVYTISESRTISRIWSRITTGR